MLAVIHFVVTLGGEPHLWATYFMGKPVTGDPGLLFYPVALALRLGPVATTRLVLLPVLAALRRPLRSPALFWLVVFVVVFVDMMAIGAKKFDRYMLPALAVMTVLGGAGIWALARQLAGRRGIAVLALAALGQGLWLWNTYPYPIAAYNPLFG